MAGTAADDAELAAIYDAFVDPSYVNDRRVTFERSAPGFLDSLIEHGLMAETDRVEQSAVLSELVSVHRSFRGMLIDALRERALSLLGDERGAVERAAVCLSPTAGLNALITTTQTGRPVVILNSGVFEVVQPLLRCVTEFLPNAKSHQDSLQARTESLRTFSHALASLAFYASVGDEEFLSSGSLAHVYKRAMGSETLTESFVPSVNVTQHAMTIEMFLLLHEYGHLASGHLDAARTSDFRVGSLLLPRYADDHNGEFEADAYAMQRVLRDKTAPVRVAFSIVTLFHFLELCEGISAYVLGRSLSDHPTARARLKNLSHGIMEAAPQSAPLLACVGRLFDGAKLAIGETLVAAGHRPADAPI